MAKIEEHGYRLGHANRTATACRRFAVETARAFRSNALPCAIGRLDLGDDRFLDDCGSGIDILALRTTGIQLNRPPDACHVWNHGDRFGVVRLSHIPKAIISTPPIFYGNCINRSRPIS